MKISTRGRYGLRAMIDLALHENEGRVTLAGIAVRQDPVSYTHLREKGAYKRKVERMIDR